MNPLVEQSAVDSGLVFDPTRWERYAFGPPQPLPPIANESELGAVASRLARIGSTDALVGQIEPLPPVFERAKIKVLPTPPSAGATVMPRDVEPADIISAPKSKSGGGASGMGGPLGGKAPLSLRGFWGPPTNVQGQDTDLGVNMQSVNVGFPLSRPSPDRGMWLGIANFERLEFSSQALLPDTTFRVPSQLWSLQVGTMHTRQFANGWNGGGMFLFGSASDRPFAALRDMTLTAMLFANHLARNERDSWSLSMFYSPTSQLPYPLPGLAYVWRPSPKLEASLGMPASLLYRPTDQFTLGFTYVPLTNFAARANHEFNQDWSLYSSYQIYNETYFLAERIETRERFYVFDQRIRIGLERALRSGFALDFAVLYMFDRQLFQGVNFSSDRQDALRFDPGIGLNAQLLWRR